MANVRQLFCYCGLAIGLVCGVITILITVAIVRTLLLEESVDYIKVKSETFLLSDSEFDKYVEIFGGAIQYQTVSIESDNYNREELFQLQKFLFRNYPVVFNNSLVEVDIVNEFSLLLTVHGSDPSLKPYFLTAHMDVVPVDPEQWSLPPFLGKVVSDPETGKPTIWGRGSLDNKSGVIGILCALDLLFKNNWKPLRTFYVGFGHDEEVSGRDGAGSIGKLLSERNVQLDFLLDEGVPITQGVMDGIDTPVALVGVTEKGRMEIRLTAQGQGAHSSIPPKPNEQAVQILSKSIANLYRYPQPSMFGSGPEEHMFKYLAPKANWPHKLLFSNTWLFGPLLSFVMSLKSISDAIIRTTTAVTIVNAGYKSNVIPATASAHINHRVHPSQKLDEVLAHDIAAIGDPRVKVEVLDSFEPHPISPYGPDSVPFSLIAGAVQHVYPDAITVPGILVGNTDTRHYLNLTENIYRMMPIIINASQVKTIHSSNENISLKSFRDALHFFYTLIRNAEAMANYGN